MESRVGDSENGNARRATAERNTMPTVAIYARVSTKDRGQETENQLVQLRGFAASQGWTVFAEFGDHESGSHYDRPHFKHMFKAASQRKVDVLLCWSQIRLSREGLPQTLQNLH